MLRGCECDPNNPVRLPDCFIIHALQTSQKARDDFNRLYPVLFPCEKERFDILFEDNPFNAKLREDQTVTEDKFQRKMNQIPVYTSILRGAHRVPTTQVAQVVNLPPHLAPSAQPKGCK